MQKVLFIPFFTVVVLVGCIFPEPALTPTSTTTNVLCAAATVELFHQVENPSTYILVLVEGTPSHSRETEQLLEIFSKALPRLVLLGDGLGLALMEPHDLNSALIVDISSTSLPQPLLPTPYATPTVPQTKNIEFATPEAPQSSIAQQAATRTAHATEQAGIEILTKSAEQYNCQITNWNLSYQSTVTAWEQQNSRSFDDLVAHIRQGIGHIDSEQFVETTRVYEALSLASLVLENKCNKYAACALLIFSDLSEFRLEKPPDLHINLSNARVLVAFGDPTCSILYNPGCQQRIEQWLPQFASYGAVNVQFTNDLELENGIKLLLGRP